MKDFSRIDGLTPGMLRRSVGGFALAVVSLSGCQRNAVLIPNSDGSLNKKAITFSEEAAKRFPYPAALERGGELQARAELGYMWNVITLVNYSKSDWSDVELWVNKQYVLPLEHVESGVTKRLPFKIIYNDKNQSFPDGNVQIETLELKLNGRMYDVPKQIGG